jgi:hypothetical protein
MVGPLFLSAESKRRGTHGTRPRGSPRVLGKRALILVNQIFLQVEKLPSAPSNLE